MNTLRDRSILVLGLGDSGLAMACWAVRAGAQVRVWDSREAPPQLASLREHCPRAEFTSAPLTAEAIAGVQLVLKSPGLAPHDARLAAVYASGLPVRGELSLFADALAALRESQAYAPAVLAITGTNGKTTTTSMTAQLAERAGRRVAMAGNIGPTLLDTLTRALDARDADGHAEPLPEVWVLELSSFQLDGVDNFEPTAAAVLNLTQDHLDWHGDMAAYGAAKARVFGRAGLMVVNRDDALVEAMVPAPVLVPQGRGRAAKLEGRRVVRFGLGAPAAPGDFGLVDEAGMAWLVRAREADETIRRRPGEAEEILIQRLMPADALRVRGRHNAANALAALALCTAAGLPLALLLHGLREYRGEPHRVEHVLTLEGVDFYDDSKGTNVGATVAAIKGLGADRAPARLVLILGGDGKGQDFAPLREGVAAHGRAVALIGRDAPQVEAALAGLEIPMERHATLEDATRWACAQARPGDSVLLSPACASLDMFRNYAHRAEVFVATAQELANDRGLA
ncbi:MAG: UDP-N-acetylmuramoyl-L-alanine--D-glutamate ligase [Pelomonas sp.]|nr:UDP-N-acetylmuramoyl-L-alanine--D-glutamate ligase [Roseateles sp.]